MATWFISYQVLHIDAIVSSIHVYAGSRGHDYEENKTLIEWEAEFMRAKPGTKFLADGPMRFCLLRGDVAAALIYAFSRPLDEGDTRVPESSNCLNCLNCLNCFNYLHCLNCLN